MKGTQIAGLIVVLLFLGGLIASKSGAPRSPGADAAGDGAHSMEAASPPDGEQEDFDIVEYYDGKPAEATREPAQVQGADDADATAPARALPKLVELGSVGCMPCEMMQPILKELRTELEGKVEVEVIDVAKDNAAARRYGIMTIPTIVWEDAEGNELDRHIGMMEKQEIMDKMRELKMLD